MIESSFNNPFEDFTGASAISIEDAPEYARKFLKKYGRRKAIEIAFIEEGKSLADSNMPAVFFWVHVQDWLNPYPVKLLH